MTGVARPESEMSFLEILNGPQREAVTHPSGPLLVLAGAGSGKTRVLTVRIAYLIRDRAVSPSALLAVTFTNKAAQEMQERVDALLGGRPRGLWVCTFHAACVRILRADGASAGIPRDFVIYDAGDALALVRETQKEFGISAELYPPKSIASRISLLKNRMIGPEDMTAQRGGFGFEQKAAVVYERYQERLRASRALDFDDLLRETVRLLESSPDVLAAYRRRFRYLLIDEYQDTNAVQYRLMRLLGDGERNITVVGDDDQSIYRFRGADVSNILHFQRDYPDAAVVKLEENYRSTQSILTAAGAVVAENSRRLAKDLWTRAAGGEKIRLIEACDGAREAAYIAAQILEGVRGEGREYGQVAILYRTNVQSRILEEKLRTDGIPYRIVGGVRFYERKEIKDLLAYLRVVVNPLVGVSLKRILSTPARGIGPGLTAKLEARTSDGAALWEAVLAEAPRSREVDGFRETIESLKALARAASVQAVLRAVLERTGYREYIARSADGEKDARLENIEELLSAAGQFDAERGGGPGLEPFLDRVALVTETDANESGGAVSLMTLHAAKGLEFPVVFIAGMEEGIFPHAQSTTDSMQLEEERRLCYVGMTRARERLTLTRARSRQWMGKTIFNQASRFLDAIPADLAEEGILRAPAAATDRKIGTSGRTDSASAGEEDGFRIGSRVRHPTFGIGTVRLREGRGDDLRVTVHFAAGGVRKLSVKLAHLSGG